MASTPAAACASARASSNRPIAIWLAPSSRSAAAAAGSRANARTGAPLAVSALMIARPVLPAAPVTRIIARPSRFLCCSARRPLGDQLEQTVRTQRDFIQLDAALGESERILDRLREQRPDRNRAGLARALDAERIERRFGHGVANIHV